VAAVEQVAPQHAEKSAYYSKFISDDDHPMNNWLVFEMIGVLAGAFLMGGLAGRLRFKTEHSPNISVRKRLIFAALGVCFSAWVRRLPGGVPAVRPSVVPLC